MTSLRKTPWRPPLSWQPLVALTTVLAALLLAGAALAHNVTEGDAGYVQEVTGFRPVAFIYLGAKHMVTGYDHLLFLAGVIFFLYRSKDIANYVGSGQNMGVVVGDLACAKVSSLYWGLPWTYGLQSKRPSTTGRSALISLTAFLDHTG